MNGWRVGVSAIGLSLAEVAARKDDPVDAALAAWRASRGLDFLLVMSAHFSDGSFHRELGTNAQGDAAAALLPSLVRLSLSCACRSAPSHACLRCPGVGAGDVAADAGAAGAAAARVACARQRV